MKKLIFIFTAFVGMTFAACGNKTVDDTTANDSLDTVTVDSVDSLDICND